MPYVKSALQPNERVLNATRIHPFIIGPAVMLGVVGLIAQWWVLQYWPRDHQLLTFIQEYIETFELHSQPLLLWICYAILGVSAFKFMQAIVYAISTELVVTSRRIIGRRGLIRRRTIDITLTRFESFETDDQSIMGRLVGYGTLIVHGTGGTRFTIHTVTRPLTFRDCVHRDIERALNFPHAGISSTERKATHSSQSSPVSPKTIQPTPQRQRSEQGASLEASPVDVLTHKGPYAG